MAKDINFVLKNYKEEKISIGKASEIAGISISEMMDLLAKFGIKSPITYEDYLEGKKFAEKIL